MSQFIQTKSGYINLDAVVRMKIVRDAFQVWYREGDGIETTFTYGTRTLEDYTGSTVVALPGYFVVTVVSKEPYDVWKTPIIAWRLIDGCAAPVCADTIPSDFGILDPTGAVTVPLTGWYESLESYRAEMIEEHTATKRLQQSDAASKPAE